MSITYETILQYKDTKISLLTDQPFFLCMDPRVKICNMLHFFLNICRMFHTARKIIPDNFESDVKDAEI